MDKDVVHIYNGLRLSHKKERNMPFAATWMGLEILALSQARQNDKNHLISLIRGISQTMHNELTYEVGADFKRRAVKCGGGGIH